MSRNPSVQPTTAEEAIKRAFESGVLVLKDRQTGSAFQPEDWDQVSDFLEPVEFARVMWPRGRGPFRYVRQLHFRGASVHEDFRYEFERGLVTGLTVAMPFGLKSEARKIEDRILEAARRLGWEGKEAHDAPPETAELLEKDLKLQEILSGAWDRWQEDWLDWNRKHPVAPKGIQDDSWLNVDFAAFPPGTVGATSFKWAFLAAFDRGHIHFGAQKPDFLEFWLESEWGNYTGRVVALWLPKAQAIRRLEDDEVDEKLGRSAWVGYLFAAKDQRPYVTTQRCLESGWLPPPGQPCMPAVIATRIPKELRFWTSSKPKDRLKRMEELVDWADEQDWYERKNVADWPVNLEEILRCE